MSCGLDSTGKGCGAPEKVEFFVSEKDGAGQLRERSYEYSHRLLSLYSVQFELSRSPNPNAQGEWISLTGPRDNLEKAKDLVLHSFLPTCCVELASNHQTSAEQLSTTSKSMALAVHSSHYDTTAVSLPPPPPPPASSTIPYSQNMSPPGLYQSSSHHHSNSSSISPPYYPLSIDTQTRVEPTPATSTIDSKEQHLRNVILQLSPEQLKNILLDATTQKQHQAPSHHRLQGSRSHQLLSRAPDEREKKIDYFVNTLNYPREKVESVLDQLGPNAADNDILERLVKVCKPSNMRPPPSSSSIIGNSGGGSIGQYQLQGDISSMTSPSQFSPPLPPMAGGSIVAPQPLQVQDPARLRYIVIDGSNVAMRHGNGNFYSCRGIQLAVDFFRRRGHDKITVFVPEWRKEASRPETPISEQHLLHELEREGVLKYTPSRRIRGKRVACYDDRYILDLATNKDGVIVSNDQFRDLMDDKPEWREVVETRLIPFQFVDDLFMPAMDPMGKDGPTLDELLMINPTVIPGQPKQLPGGLSGTRQLCPYQEKCTFGRKCKFYHPEREPRNEPAAANCTPKSSTSPIDSRTPNASRSATPSPSPEKGVSRYSHSNRSSGEDLRQVNSHNGSTDDLSLYHHGNSTVDISELLRGSLQIHDGPPTAVPPLAPTSSQQGYYDYPRNSRPIPPHSVNIPPASIHSAPVFSNTADSAAASDSSQHQHRYTFPMAVLPHPHHINSRTHVVTEQHHRVVLQGGGGVSHSGAGGVASAVGIPPLTSELDPSIMYTPSHHHHQHHPILPPGGYPTGYHPPDVSVLPPSTNPVSHQAAGSQPVPGMFMTRDGWALPSATHYPLTPHELHGHGGSLIPAPPGFYPSSQGQPPNTLPGYNSRDAGANSVLHNSHSHSHSLGTSVTVPSTRTSPYHQRHVHVQHEFASHPHSQHRHQSIDFGIGNHPNVSPQRRGNYSTEGQKVNGHLPQASTSSGYYRGGHYINDYSQHQQGSAFSSLTGTVGHPFHNPQSHHSSSSSSRAGPTPGPQHQPLPPLPPHYHCLPAVTERPHENGGVVMDPASKCEILRNSSLFRKLAAVFPGCDDMILSVMLTHVQVTDFEELVQLVQQVVVTSQ